MYKILNLYCGLGGNRKLWQNCKVTAIENNKEIAKLYQTYYPQDTVIVGDAHKYLLEHISEHFDLIWSSPPCPTHSQLKIAAVFSGRGTNKPVYPDMRLYQEIILLKYFANRKTKWVVENVDPYYSTLIKPQVIINRHCFWSNFYIPKRNFKEENKVEFIEGGAVHYGFDLRNEEIKSIKKRVLLRNLVNPEIGLYILQESLKRKTPLFNFNY